MVYFILFWWYFILAKYLFKFNLQNWHLWKWAYFGFGWLDFKLYLDQIMKYTTIFAEKFEPKNRGWFAFLSSNRERCLASLFSGSLTKHSKNWQVGHRVKAWGESYFRCIIFTMVNTAWKHNFWWLSYYFHRNGDIDRQNCCRSTESTDTPKIDFTACICTFARAAQLLVR